MKICQNAQLFSNCAGMQCGGSCCNGGCFPRCPNARRYGHSGTWRTLVRAPDGSFRIENRNPFFFPVLCTDVFFAPVVWLVNLLRFGDDSARWTTFYLGPIRAGMQSRFAQLLRLGRRFEVPQCIICMDAPANTQMSQCGHNHICRGCANQLVALQGEGRVKCPSCNTTGNKIRNWPPEGEDDGLEDA